MGGQPSASEAHSPPPNLHHQNPAGPFQLGTATKLESPSGGAGGHAHPESDHAHREQLSSSFGRVLPSSLELGLKATVEQRPVDGKLELASLAKGEERAAAASTSAGGPASSSGNSAGRLDQIECTLDNKDMWHRFHPLDTEMIITKQGR